MKNVANEFRSLLKLDNDWQKSEKNECTIPLSPSPLFMHFSEAYSTVEPIYKKKKKKSFWWQKAFKARLYLNTKLWHLTVVLSLLLTVLYRQCSHFRTRFIVHACICFCVWVCLCVWDACVWPSLGNSSFCSRVVDQTETSLLLLTKEREREREGLHVDLSYLLVRCWIHKRTMWKWL